jgi:toxin ParE2
MAAADRIVRYPDAWQPLGEDIRRYRLSRFPYGVIYAIESGDIVVLAIAHLHRKPDYWRDRLQKT